MNTKLSPTQKTVLDRLAKGDKIRKSYGLGCCWQNGPIGKESTVSRSTLSALNKAGYVDIVDRQGGAAAGTTTWGITDKGKEALKTATVVTPKKNDDEPFLTSVLTGFEGMAKAVERKLQKAPFGASWKISDRQMDGFELMRVSFFGGEKHYDLLREYIGVQLIRKYAIEFLN